VSGPTRETEQKVLKLCDQLIEKVIAVDVTEGEERDRSLKEAQALFAALLKELENYLQGKEHLLENLAREVIKQKLPDPRVLESFPEFGHNLERIMAEGFRALGENDAPVRPEEPEQDLAADPLELALKDVFSGEPLQTNFEVNHAIIPYYLPQLGMAVMVRPQDQTAEILVRQCRQKGIRLVYIEPGDLNNPRRLRRILRQARFR